MKNRFILPGSRAMEWPLWGAIAAGFSPCPEAPAECV